MKRYGAVIILKYTIYRKGYFIFPHVILAGDAYGFSFSLPTKINIHGFLTVNGEKNVKSAAFINAAD